MAVDFFFVISGFLMARSWEMTLRFLYFDVGHHRTAHLG
jgi:hypothetical protein